MKKIVLSIGMLLIISFMLFGCGNNQIDIEAIDIEAIDRIDVPAGTYTIQYTIEDMSDLIKNHGAIVSFTVKNSQNETINVTGNTFTVVANEVYTVKIKLTIGDVYKEKTITVTSVIETSPVLVSFNLNGGTGSFPALSITRGTSLTLVTQPTKDGFTFEGWYLEASFQTLYTNQVINENTTLYAKWEAIVITTVNISFDLQGGQGTFPNQTIQIGLHAQRPQQTPTKEGFIFRGWYPSLTSSQPFDFETQVIYGDTIIYALWDIDQTVTYTVTYLLNGAFQPEPITEIVEEGKSPIGPTTEFMYQHHLFKGWSKEEVTEVPETLDQIIITSDITLYAVWHIDFDVIDGSSLFIEYTRTNASTLQDGFVEQRYQFRSVMRLGHAESTLAITDDRVDYGLLYSTEAEVPTYYNQDTKRIVALFDQYEKLSALPILNIRSIPLQSDETYYFVLYARYEHTIIYSEVYSFHTYIAVPEGSVIGAENILSGAYYKIDTVNPNFRPAAFIRILDGFTATLDDIGYASYSELYREGIRRLVTKETETGKEYLHVFNLEFKKLPVSLSFTKMIENGTSFIPEYRAIFPFEDEIHYPISEVGVLYSTAHPFLKLNVPEVSKKIASFDLDDDYFVTNSAISGSKNTVYIRGYIVVKGIVSYSPQVTKLTFDTSENIYVVSETIDIFEEKVSPEYGTSGSYGSAVMRVYQVQGDAMLYVDYPSSYELQNEAQYFIRNANGTGVITDLLIIDDFPEVVGVSNLGQYLNSVFISYDRYSPYWYYALNGGDYVNLPAQVRLSLPGYYELYYRTGAGIEKITFEITQELVE